MISLFISVSGFHISQLPQNDTRYSCAYLGVTGSCGWCVVVTQSLTPIYMTHLRSAYKPGLERKRIPWRCGGSRRGGKGIWGTVSMCRKREKNSFWSKAAKGLERLAKMSKRAGQMQYSRPGGSRFHLKMRIFVKAAEG